MSIGDHEVRMTGEEVFRPRGFHVGVDTVYYDDCGLLTVVLSVGCWIGAQDDIPL